MNDQLLPDFDGPQDLSDPAKPGPKKPRPRSQRKRPAKKAKAPVLKSAKRVPKKRKVRKTTSSTFRLPPQPTTRPNEPLLTSKEFDVTFQVFKILGEFDPQIRKRMLARLQGAL